MGSSAATSPRWSPRATGNVGRNWTNWSACSSWFGVLKLVMNAAVHKQNHYAALRAVDTIARFRGLLTNPAERCGRLADADEDPPEDDTPIPDQTDLDRPEPPADFTPEMPQMNATR